MIVLLSTPGCSRYLQEAKQEDAFNDTMVGDDLFIRGDYGDALLRYQEAVRKEPKQWIAHLRIAQIYERKLRYQDAVYEYKICMDIGPHSDAADNAWAHFRLGKAMAEAGDKQEARNELNAALSYSSKCDKKATALIKMTSQIRAMLNAMSKNQDINAVIGEPTAPFGAFGKAA